MAERATNLLRELPSVDRLLNHPRSAVLLARYNRNYVTQKFRQTLDRLRESIQKDHSVSGEELTDDSILACVE